MSIAYDQEIQLRISTTAEGGQELDRLASKMEGLESELEGLAKASKEANAAQLEAANKLNDARAKQEQIKRTLNETNEAYKALMEQVRKGGEGQQKYADEAAATRQRMDQLRASLNEAGKDVFRLNDEYKRSTAQSRFLAAEQRRVSGELKETGTAAERVRARLRELRDGAKEASGVFDGMRGKIAGAIAAVGGFFAVKRGFQDVTGAAETLDVQMRKIEATIQATQGAAGLTVVEIGDMAERLDEATLGSAEGFRNAAAKLLTFKSVSKDAFETTLKLAQDLAANGFGSLETNVVQLGKALENPKQGISALAEAGVTFTDQQKALIAYLVETGKQAQAQGVILEAVAGQVSGVANAVGQGMSGAADLAGKRFTDFKELLGKGVIPVLANMYNGIADVLAQLNNSGAVERFGEAAGRVFKSAGEAFLRFVGQVDLDALAARMSTWADQSGEAISRWIAHLENAGNVAKLVYSSIATGANTILSAIYKLGEAFSGVASNIQSGLAIILDGMSKVTFGELSERFKGWADEVRLSAEATWSVSEAYASEAAAAFDRAADSAESFQAAWAGLTETAPQAGAAIAQAGQQAALTADQVDALGENTEFVNGAFRQTPTVAAGAASGLSGVSDAARAAADAQMAATKQTLAVEAAFARLGLTSSATLKKQATEAREAYDTIKASGLATAEDLKAAFEVYAQRAIAANNGVASDTLRTEAAMQGVRLETQRTADAADGAAAAFGKIARNAGAAADAASGLANASGSFLDGGRQADRAVDVESMLYAQGATIEEAKAAAKYYGELFEREQATTLTGYLGNDQRAARLTNVANDRALRQAIELARVELTTGQQVDIGNSVSDYRKQALANIKYGPSINGQKAQSQAIVSAGRQAISQTYRIDLSFNGKKGAQVSVASESEANQVKNFFRMIEADMRRAL